MASLSTTAPTDGTVQMTELSTQTIDGKKQELVRLLKEKYREQYHAIVPTPWRKEKKHCIDDMFVENGVLALVNNNITKAEEPLWERLHSYKDIFRDPRLKSNRRIIEGEPGYGKSMLTLQLAYDWCNGVIDSPLADVEILILLRLRQLKNVTSIYKAIRLYLAPSMNITDVKSIIDSTSSVALQLDGYDEYPEKDKVSDIQKIIKLDMFSEVDVTLTTRYLPKEYEKSKTKRIQLTGFNETARDQYIRKAVCSNDENAITNIMTYLKENVVLDDLCQVPLFLAMFSQMSHLSKDSPTFTSVTTLFRKLIRCFFYHTRNKSEEYNVARYETPQQFEHEELSKVAFERISTGNHNITWRKEVLLKKIGTESYDYHIRIGILVEEQVYTVSDEHTLSDNIPLDIEVHFYHNIFCEWYASFQLVKIAANERHVISLEETLRKMNPFDLQYVYLFACGLNPTAGERIIDYLESKDYDDKFAILCIQEFSDEFERIETSVRKLCSKKVFIRRNDGKLLKRSTVDLLKMASSHDIPIADLHLKWSYSNVEEGHIVLHSSLRLPSLHTLKKLSINGNREKISEGDVIGLINYGQQSQRFEEIWFYYCDLPKFITCDEIHSSQGRKTIKVMRPSHASKLNFQSGGWKKVDAVSDIKEMCSSTVVIDNKTDKEVQISAAELVKKADNHDIPIYGVSFKESFKFVQGDKLVLYSGISLPTLRSVEKVWIRTETGREMDADEVNGILNHLRNWQKLQKLYFSYCLLPNTLSGHYSPDMESRDVSVYWYPYGGGKRSYQLCIRSGHWLLREETTSLFPMKCIGEELSESDHEEEISAFRQHWSQEKR